MAFFRELLARFEEALEWPTDPFVRDDDVTEPWGVVAEPTATPSLAPPPSAA